MKYFSLFTGIGGFELGIQKAYVDTINRSQNRKSEKDPEAHAEAGQRLESAPGENTGATDRRDGQHDNGAPEQGEPTCVGYSEIDKYAVEIYQKHFPTHKNYGDITRINEKELPDFELLVGGFPCQAFSIAGKRQGFADTRGTLFFDIARILRAKQPRLLLLENVKGLLSHDSGNTFKTIVATLTELGYDLQWQVLNSKNHGVPQNRERIIIVGNIRGTPRPEVFPLKGERKLLASGEPETEEAIATTLRAKIGGPDIDETYIYQLPRGKNEGGNHAIAPTVTSNLWEHNNVLIKSGQVRRLTPVECERLQGFPDRWTEGISDTQRRKVIGNAVTTNVIADVVKKII